MNQVLSSQLFIARIVYPIQVVINNHMWAIMYVVHAGMPANVPQVTSISLNELLKIPLSSEIEAVAEVEKLEHTESSVILWVRESIQTPTYQQ